MIGLGYVVCRKDMWHISEAVTCTGIICPSCVCLVLRTKKDLKQTNKRQKNILNLD